MTSRREAILEAIVREYVETAEPVGSLTLVRKYAFPYSSATIRAEMAMLEENGFIMQPHTSAGRIPTEKGYKYFVKMIENEEKSLAGREEDILKKRIEAMHAQYERKFDAAALALAEMTRNVALSTLGQEVYSHGLANLFRQPEFIDTDRVLGIADMIDNMSTLLNELPRSKNFMVLVGSETPIGKSADASLVISRVDTPYGVRGYLGVLGPTRMSYERVIPLVKRTRDLLENDLNR